MIKHSKYDNMKNTNIPWVKEIPSHWALSRMKEIFQNITDKGHPQAEVLSLYREYGVLPKNSRTDNHNVTSEDTASYKYVQIGDLVINKMKAWQGSLGVSDFEGIISPAYYVCHFKNNQYIKRYFHYLLRSKAYAQEFERLSTGMRVGQWDLNINDFMCVPVIIPPASEQVAIASYLDVQCTQIDSVIDYAKNTIADYNNLKISVINEIITKGLDKNAKMRDSKINWIGFIPQHWECCKQKYVIKLLNGRAFKDSEFKISAKYPVLRVGNLFTNSKWYYSDLELDADKYCETGDLLYAWSASYGPLIWQGERVIYHYHIWKVLLDKKIDKMFAFYYFLALSNNIISESHGSTMSHITMNRMNNTYIAFPSIKEQKEIANYLDNLCEKINEIIDEKETLISDLETYKKSLIYEFVTGKRKVV